MIGKYVVQLILLLMMILSSSTAIAANAEPVSTKFLVGNMWLLIAAGLVFVMHLGFAMLEAGLTQGKNTANILFKNVSIVSIGTITYAIVGFNLMYPGAAFSGGIFGLSGFGIGTDASGLSPAYNPAYTYWTDFLFQGMFAATAATIVSGAVAERVKLFSFLVFATILVTFCYPIVGMWKWGGGFLHTMSTPFYDFAGSTLVHSVGGWAALAAAIVLGPRLGKYVDGKMNSIAPHSMPLATIGVFLLWFGWFGFNGGSVLSADPGAVSLVFVTTMLAACAGVLGAGVACKFVLNRPDLSMILNGALAGLVGITAGADQMSPFSAIIIGFIAGGIVVCSVELFDKIIKIDDPVGAISVHLVCGVWGTLAVGLFGNLASGAQVVSQLIGIACVGAFTLTFSFSALYIIKATMGFRVTEEEERHGLDMSEHGASAYRGMSLLLDQEKIMAKLTEELTSYAAHHSQGADQGLETVLSSQNEESSALTGRSPI